MTKVIFCFGRHHVLLESEGIDLQVDSVDFDNPENSPLITTEAPVYC